MAEFGDEVGDVGLGASYGGLSAVVNGDGFDDGKGGVTVES